MEIFNNLFMKHHLQQLQYQAYERASGSAVGANLLRRLEQVKPSSAVQAVSETTRESVQEKISPQGGEGEGAS